MNAALIIPCFNRREITLHCLRHLAELGVGEWATIVVVDDASTDGTQEAIAEEFPTVEVIEGSGDLWWGGAINVGMAWALEHDSELIFWLNDDGLPRKGSLEAMCRVSNERDVITTASGILRETGRVHYGGMEKTPTYTRVLECPPGENRLCETICGNCVCFPASAVKKIGWIDTSAFPHFAGDADYGFRASSMGIPILIVGDAICDCSYGQSKNRMSWLLGDLTVAELWKVCFHPRAGALAWCGLIFKYRHWGARGVADYLVSLGRLICVTVVRCLIPLSWLQKALGKRHQVHQQMQAVKQWEEKHS